MQLPTLSTSSVTDAPQAPAITVVDSIMGSGKTTYAVEMIRRTWEQETGKLFNCTDDFTPTSFLYIVPTLDEVDRIQAELPELDFQAPSYAIGRKFDHLKELIEGGQNIVSTHALFQLLTQEAVELLEGQGYVLVIDEALECVKPFDLSSSDRRLLRNSQRPLTYLDAENRLRWNYDEDADYAGRFSDIKRLCDNNSLVLHRDQFFLWEFPWEAFRVFSQVYILTYLFEGSPMSSYLRAKGFPYRRFGLQEGELRPVDEIDDAGIRQHLRELITIVDDRKLNAVGSPIGRRQPLSKSWFDQELAKERKDGSEALRRLRLNTESFFRRYAKTTTKDNLWTTFKDARGRLKGGGYAKGFIPVNAKATNDHIEKKSLAYLANVFYRPDVASYFRDQGVAFDEDLHALSEMLQWIWRSQVRREDPILVYIPSQRMRELLQRWLAGGVDGSGSRFARFPR